MASEHVHQWELWSLVGEPADLRHRLCTVCGAEETYTADKRVEYTNVDVVALQQLEQQLAQAQHELIIEKAAHYLAQTDRVRLREENAAMRALLERISNEFISSSRQRDQCCFCSAVYVYPGPLLQHEEDCPVAQIRAFLADKLYTLQKQFKEASDEEAKQAEP